MADTSALRAFLAHALAAESAWDRFFAAKIEAAGDRHWQQEAYRCYQRMIKQGKHLRPLLIILGYRLAGGDPADERIRLASSCVEIIHNAFLIHDDVLDNSDLRRNEPTVHRQLATSFGQGSDAAADLAFGRNMAINFGDLGQALAQEALYAAGFPPAETAAAVALFNEHVQNTVVGQMFDMDPVPLDRLTPRIVRIIQEFKTAYYSAVLPLHLGYTLGGGAEWRLAPLRTYGIDLGVAFQIQDDYLGMFGTETKLGKSVDSDLKEGKKTLLFLHAYSHSNADDQAFLCQVHGNPEASGDEVERVRTIMRSTGADTASQEEARRLAEEALAQVDALQADAESSRILAELIAFVTERDH